MPAMISFRSVVDPSDCDFLAQMNVSRYFAACSDGVFAIQSEKGLTANDNTIRSLARKSDMYPLRNHPMLDIGLCCFTIERN